MEQEQEQEPEAVMEQEPECMAVPMVSEEGVAVSEEGPKVQEERMEASVAVGRPRRSCFAGSMDEDSLAQRTAERSERAGMTAYSKGTVPEGAQKGGARHLRCRVGRKATSRSANGRWQTPNPCAHRSTASRVQRGRSLRRASRSRCLCMTGRMMRGTP